MRNRSAISGKAVSDKFAKSNPSTTVREGKSKDTKRLDWIAAFEQSIDFGLDGTVFIHAVPRGKKLRTAIDAAMKGK